MITFEEAGITEEQRDALLVETENQIFEVTAYKWVPAFVNKFIAGTDGAAFGSVSHAGSVYRASGDGFWRRGEDGEWETAPSFSIPDDYISRAPFSLVSEGDDIFMFTLTTSGIVRGIWNEDLVDYLGMDWELIVLNGTIDFFAATASDTVHYLTRASAMYRFNVATGVSWDITTADIYWGFTILSFDAQRLDGVDILTFASELPGIQSTKVVGTKAVTFMQPTGGVCGMTYKYGDWSDHFLLDRVDNWCEWRFRNNLKLTEHEGVLHLVAYSSEGTKETPIRGYRYYGSKDGYHWSKGELMQFSGTTAGGVALHFITDEDDQPLTIAVNRRRVDEAPSTLWFTDAPADVNIIDLTDEVAKMSINWREVQQVGMTIHNVDDWINNTFLNGEHTVALIVKTGIHYGEDDILVQVGVFEVDTITPSQEIPEKMVDLVARDRMAWLLSKSESEQYRDWAPQSVGGDDYVDPDGTGYGGMTHTAPVDGSWQASGQTLRLTSNNKQGSVFSTLTHDTWNGSISGYFGLASLGNDENGGLIFRAVDRLNYWSLRYDQGDDKLHIYSWYNGTPTLVWSSSTMSWSGATSSRYIRVDYRYNKLTLYKSAFGAWWDYFDTVIVPGVARAPGVNANLEDPALIQAGYMGFTGKGFSDEEGYTGLTFPVIIPPPKTEPVDLPSNDEPTYVSSYRPDTPLYSMKTTTTIMAAVSPNGHVWTTTNFGATNPTWTDEGILVDSGTGHNFEFIYQFEVDSFSPLYLGTGSQVNGYIFGDLAGSPDNKGIYRVVDLFGTMTVTAIIVDPDILAMKVSLGFPNWVTGAGWKAQNGPHYITSVGSSLGINLSFVSTDGVSGGEHEQTPNTPQQDNASLFPRTIWPSSVIPGYAYMPVYATNDMGDTGPGLFKSTNYGVNFGNPGVLDISDLDTDKGLYAMHIPYQNLDDTELWYTVFQDFPRLVRLYYLNNGVETDRSPLVGGIPTSGLFWNSIATYPLDSTKMALAALASTDVPAGRFVSSNSGVAWTTISSEAPDVGHVALGCVDFYIDDPDYTIWWNTGLYIRQAGVLSGALQNKSGSGGSAISGGVVGWARGD